MTECQWVGCNKPATVRIIRANAYVCDEHYLMLQYRTVIGYGEIIDSKPQGKWSDWQDVFTVEDD